MFFWFLSMFYRNCQVFFWYIIKLFYWTLKLCFTSNIFKCQTKLIALCILCTQIELIDAVYKSGAQIPRIGVTQIFWTKIFIFIHVASIKKFISTVLLDYCWLLLTTLDYGWTLHLLGWKCPCYGKTLHLLGREVSCLLHYGRTIN